MTAQLLTSELTALIQETKRKNSDLRNVRQAAEKSLSDLKALPHTSEAQIAADLKCRSNFVRPFLLACSTRNLKIVGSAIVCLQRLVITKGLPNELLSDVLEAFRECSSLGLDIQLKVLQALPSLLQNYAGSLTGELLVAAFQVCFLLHGSKIAVVSNTAAATLQQLILSTFEKVAEEDSQVSDDEAVTEVPTADGTVFIGSARLDAYHVLKDVCLLTEGQVPETLNAASLSQNFGLELLESVLSNHVDTILAHPEQIHIFRIGLMPLVVKLVSGRASFSATVRAMRLLHLIFDRLLLSLLPECEIALSLLNHMLDADAAAVWKRTLCLEVLRAIYAEPTLIRSIYSHYDEQDGKRNIVRDNLATLVRLASERPALIGSGSRSTMPTLISRPEDEQAANQASGIIGTIGSAVSMLDLNAPGISIQWSTVRVPCIDQLDKNEAPSLPSTYIYSLALTCINTFSEGLARFLLPFTIPSESKAKRRQRIAQESEEDSYMGLTGAGPTPISDDRKELSRSRSFRGRRMPVNPLSLENHALYSQICISGHIVETCWPALLAVCSTFLNATLDSDHHHALVRSFQKFTQVAGVLGLSTPRDAFLTTLGKYAVPSANLNLLIPDSASNGRDNTKYADDFAGSDGDSNPSPNVSSDRHRQSIDRGMFRLNARHLLCLRALLNLGIALGPVLGKSWSIILEALQQADQIIWHSGVARRQSSGGYSRQSSDNFNAGDIAYDTGDVVLEIKAAETAASRMFESTSDLPDRAFMDLLDCICGLLRKVPQRFQEQFVESLVSSQGVSRTSGKAASSAGAPIDVSANDRANMFVLEKLGDLIQCNTFRLVQNRTAETGWDLLIGVLVQTLSSQQMEPNIRIKATDTLNNLILTVAVSPENIADEDQDQVRRRGFIALLREVEILCKEQRQDTRVSQGCEIEIHRLALETLRSVLERCGDSLSLGWDTIFAIITSVFSRPGPISKNPGFNQPDIYPRSLKLVRSSFASLQLICSDFLNCVPYSCLPILLETLYCFCHQSQDLNISLTTTTFFRNISDFLQHDKESLELDHLTTRCSSEIELFNMINEQDLDVSLPALWLCLLVHLMHITADSRLEVRHSALHTLSRIFDISSDQFSTAAWQMCFRIIFVKMLSINQEKYHAAKISSEISNQGGIAWNDWNETAVVLIEGVSKTFAQFLSNATGNGGSAEMWKAVLENYKKLLDRQVLGVSTAVFSGITKMLAEIEEATTLGKASIERVWVIWQENSPACCPSPSKNTTDSEDAMMAYLHCLHQLFRLLNKSLIFEQARTILKELHSCVVHSNSTDHITDINEMTHVQTYVIKSLKMIPTNIPNILPELVDYIANFVTMAYRRKEEVMQKDQTYVALSKSAMVLLQSYMIEHVNPADTNATELLIRAAGALSIPLRLKYKWRTGGKDPSTWKRAAMTAVVILQNFVPFVKPPRDEDQSYSRFFEEVVKISDGVVAADTAANTSLQESDILRDQDFDIDTFSVIRDLLTATIGNPSIPDTVRRSYAQIIFQSSIIHVPHPDDLARPGQEPLEGMQSKHIGRTEDLPPNRRSKLSYILLDELFSLVAVHDSSPERIRLAQAAAPYLILRVGIILKAYTLDQPLRGRMPQPLSQKKEMLYILQKFVELDSEPKAIPPVPGVTSDHKKHLHRLYPLVMMALKAAWRDEEMTRALQRLLDAVGQDFGL